MSSDGGRVEKPQPKAAPQRAPEPQHVGVGGGLTGGTQAGDSLSAMQEGRRDAAEKAVYRATGGAQGTPPLADLAARRGAPVREAVSRIMRKPSGPSQGAAAKIPEAGGTPLPADARGRLEPKLGADLSSVRVHTGSESQAAASHYGARAFTVGNDVHFNAGQFNPGTKEGDRLLGHELTHVVQGNNAGIQRKPEEPSGESHADGEHAGADHDGASGEEDVSQPGEPAEQEADAVGDHVADSLHGDNAKDSAKKPGKAGGAGEKGAGASGLAGGHGKGQKAPGGESAGGKAGGGGEHGAAQGKDAGGEKGGAEQGAAAGAENAPGGDKAGGPEIAEKAAPKIAAKRQQATREQFGSG